MLSNRTLIFLCALLALLLVALHVSNRRLESICPDDPGRGLLSSDPDLVVRMRFETPGFTTEIFREGSLWRFAPPAMGRADATRVDLVLDTLSSVHIRDRITARQRANRHLEPAHFGLSEPRATVTISAAPGSRRETVLRFGDDTPAADGVFAQRDGTGDILVVERAALDLLPADMDSLREHTLFREPGAEISAIEIRRPGLPAIRLAVGESGAWSVTAPFSSPASAPTVAALLEYLEGATVQRFLWTPDGTGENSRAANGAEQARITHGLSADEAVLFLSVWHHNQSQPREFVFGKDDPTSPGSVLAASITDGFVCSVDRTLLDALFLPLDSLRERRIFPFVREELIGASFLTPRGPFALQRDDPGMEWTILRPAAQPADPAATAAFLDALLSLEDDNAEPMPPGSAMPLDAVRIDLTPGPFTGIAARHRTAERTFWVAPVGTNSEAIAVCNPARNLRHILFGGKASALDFSDESFSSLRSARILALPPAAVETLTHTEPGTGRMTQSVERRSDGAWFTRDPAPAYPASETADAIAGLVTNFIASGVATLFTADSAAYGLLQPRLEITIGTRLPERPVIILQVGNTLPDGSAFLRVKGSATVFTIPAEAARLLAAPLTTRTAPAP